jgi:hypothetical protein
MMTEKELAERLLQVIDLQHEKMVTIVAIQARILNEEKKPETEKFLFTSKSEYEAQMNGFLNDYNSLMNEKKEIVTFLYTMV